MDSTATMSQPIGYHAERQLARPREKPAPASHAVPVSVLPPRAVTTTTTAIAAGAAPAATAAPAVLHGMRRSKADGSKKVCPYPVDAHELSRRLQIVLVQQQSADHAARAKAAGASHNTHNNNRPPTKVPAFSKKPGVLTTGNAPQIMPHSSSTLPVSAPHRRTGSSGISSRLPSGNYATKTHTAASSGPYVPQEAAYQFTNTATATGPWRPAPAVKQHRKTPGQHQTVAATTTVLTATSTDAATVTKIVKRPDSQTISKPSHPPNETAHQERRPSFTAQHAFKDALAFPRDGDNAYKSNRKILDWAKHTADAFHQEREIDTSPRGGVGVPNRPACVSLERDVAQQRRADRGEEWKDEWTVVSSPMEPPADENRRVDWTQKDEEAESLTCEGVQAKRSGVRRPKSLWTLRMRADAGASDNEKAGSASPTMAVPPKSLRTTRSMLFSLFKNSN